jgi:hypothetical protein
MSAKRAALVTALCDGRLEYEDLGLVTARGQVFKGAPLDELVAKDRLPIDKASLRRWFEQLPFEDRPAFLFDEARQAVLPDGSDAVETNSLKGIAIMAHLLAASAGKYRAGERPNAEAIGQAVNDAAKQFSGDDVRGYASYHKKLGAALRTFNQELPQRLRVSRTSGNFPELRRVSAPTPPKLAAFQMNPKECRHAQTGPPLPSHQRR